MKRKAVAKPKISSKVVSKKRVIKAKNRSAPLIITRQKVQTAEGWKRKMAKKK
jgi:hypothetical protein